RITRPDGSVVELTGITPVGPSDVLIDASGPSPLDRYFKYDVNGRLAETGLRNLDTSQIIAGTVEKWDTDLEGLITAGHRADPANSGGLVDTTFSYDRSRHLKTVENPLLTRSFSTDAFGNVLTITESPKGDAGATGEPRTYCFRYNAYGQQTLAI